MARGDKLKVVWTWAERAALPGGLAHLRAVEANERSRGRRGDPNPSAVGSKTERGSGELIPELPRAELEELLCGTMPREPSAEPALPRRDPERRAPSLGIARERLTVNPRRATIDPERCPRWARIYLNRSEAMLPLAARRSPPPREGEAEARGLTEAELDLFLPSLEAGRADLDTPPPGRE